MEGAFESSSHFVSKVSQKNNRTTMPDSKKLPLTSDDIVSHGRQDCPDGMIPSLVLLIALTLVIVTILASKHPIRD